uniref:MFS transporter n=1 Tax=Herbaspirillum lusitanum TaxID=213312 RepID=UPI0002F0866B|nr:MFS transporter [Herbaspirillum lusitanum]
MYHFFLRFILETELKTIKDAASPWWLVGGAFLALAASTYPVIFFTFAIFLKPLAADLGWSRSVLSAALLVITVMTVVVSPLIGRLVDRIGVSYVVVPSIVVLSLAICSLGWVTDMYGYFLVFTVIGISGVAHSPLSYSREIARRFIGNRGLALGLATAGIGIGGAVMPVLAQHLIANEGWRHTYQILGGIVLIVGLGGFLVFRRGYGVPEKQEQKGALTAGEEPRIKLFGSPTFWLLAGAFFLMGTGVNGTISHLSAILTDQGAATQIAAIAQSVVGISMIAGRLMCGFMFDRFTPPRVAILFAVAPLIGVLVFALGAEQPGFFLVACILVGVAGGAEADMLAYFAALYFPMKSFSEITGYFFSAFTLGVGIGSIGLARSFDLMGSYRGGLIASAVVLGALCFIFYLLGRRPMLARQSEV